MYAESDDDDKDSLNSSFWSDGEREEVEMGRTVGGGALKSVRGASMEASEEDKSEVKESKESEEGSAGAEDDEGGDEERVSPGLSLRTSGYGTYRPEEQEAGDQDSRGDLSEMRDEEDEDDRRSACTLSAEVDASEEEEEPGDEGGEDRVRVDEGGSVGEELDDPKESSRDQDVRSIDSKQKLSEEEEEESAGLMKGTGHTRGG